MKHKIFENIIHSKILNHCINNSLISSQQHGFLNKRSTTTNLVRYLDHWTRILDDNKSLDIMYVDVEKAFDSVSHVKLLYKLSRMGIGGNVHGWLKCFLTGRTQCVRVGNMVSTFADVVSGIPQGTILGPLLFLLYVNELPQLMNNCEISLYADDSKFYGDSSSLKRCLDVAEDLLEAEYWFREWQLKINVGKCEVLHLGHSNIHFLYRINNFIVPERDHCKDLGIMVSSDLSVHSHCSKIARSAFYRLRQFKQTFLCRDVTFRIFLYTTYLRPLVESNTPVWNPYCKCDIDKIENFQRKFTKGLPGLRNMTYMERLNATKLDSLEVRRIHFDLILLFKIVHNLVDIPFDHYFSFNNNNTRGHAYKLNVNYCRTMKRKYFFTNRIVPIWNKLPGGVVSSLSLKAFKSAIKGIDFTAFCRGRAHAI